MGYIEPIVPYVLYDIGILFYVYMIGFTVTNVVVIKFLPVSSSKIQ